MKSFSVIASPSDSEWRSREASRALLEIASADERRLAMTM